MAASVRCVLILMAKVFSVPKLLLQPTHLVSFSWGVLCKTTVPVTVPLFKIIGA